MCFLRGRPTTTRAPTLKIKSPSWFAEYFKRPEILNLFIQNRQTHSIWAAALSTFYNGFMYITQQHLFFHINILKLSFSVSAFQWVFLVNLHLCCESSAATHSGLSDIVDTLTFDPLEFGSALGLCPNSGSAPLEVHVFHFLKGPLKDAPTCLHSHQ